VRSLRGRWASAPRAVWAGTCGNTAAARVASRGPDELGAWIYPSTVTDATKDLGQALKGVDLTVQSCVSLPDDVRASWAPSTSR